MEESSTSSVTRKARVAVLGAGRVGTAIARVSNEAGFDVSIAASGDPERIALIAQVLTPGVQARWTSDAVSDADIVVLAIPLHRFDAFDAALVAGKLVVDVMNYWSATDGVQQLFEETDISSSEIVQRRLIDSTVVKSFNHIGYHELESERQPAGSPTRQALGVAGDDPGAVDVVADLVERIGYDAVGFDTLRAGAILEPGGPVFGRMLTRPQFELAIQGDVAA